MNYKKFLTINIFAFLIGCSSSDLLQRDDYLQVKNQLIGNENPELALKRFPSKERGAFITSMEKAYLSILSGTPYLKDLLYHSELSKKRLRFSASREVQSLFYLETPEGYYASEHEIIWMHILLGWGFAIQGEYEKTCVEARAGSALLNSEWSPEGRFDDPMLRILMASIWNMCGDWENAKVDLRVAYNLNKKLNWILPYLKRNSPPNNLVIVLAGGGAEPIWDPDTNLNFIRGFRNIKFELPADIKNIIIKDAKEKIVKLYNSPDASNWYKRHFLRDNSIHELVEDTNYFQNSVLYTLKASGKVAGGITLAIVIVLLGLGIGAGIIYLGVLAEDGEAILLGIVLGFWITAYGVAKGSEIVDDSIKEFKEDIDTTEFYRFVRFLPEFVMVGHSDTEVNIPLVIMDKSGKYFSQKNVEPVGKNKVYMIYYPAKTR